MTPLIRTAFCVFGVLACTTGEARELFRLRQVEELAAPPGIAPPAAIPDAAPVPYQASQKLPYQASQKVLYPKVHVATRVRYVQLRPHKRTCCGCGTSVRTTLAVYDPCSRCNIEVPVSLPGCCSGAPLASGRGGLFGQSITNFTWACGYKVRVVVNRRGEAVVQYYGA